jgi:hypothetical protein
MTHNTTTSAEKYAELFQRWAAGGYDNMHDRPGYHDDPVTAAAYFSSDHSLRHAAFDQYELFGHKFPTLFVSDPEADNTTGHAFMMPGGHYPDTKKDGKTVNGDERPPIRVCDFFTVGGTSGCPRTKEETRTIHFIGRNGRPRTLILRCSDVALGGKMMAAKCASGGFTVATCDAGRRQLQNMLTAIHGPTIRPVTKLGWVSGTNAFALPPDRFIGAAGSDRFALNVDSANGAKVAQSGSFDRWKSWTARFVPGNSRLALALAMSFASPLMRFAPGSRPALLNCFGETSQGKSIAGFVFGSTWGGPGPDDDPLGFSQSWKQTSNSMAGVASAHSGVGVVFDELQLAADPASLAYDFSQGVEKGRLNADSTQKTPRRWSLYGWSSGERTLTEAVEARGKDDGVSSGREARCIDLSASREGSNGIVEQLHGMADSYAFVVNLEALTRADYGHAGPAFIEAIQAYVAEFGERALIDKVQTMRAEFRERLSLPRNANNLVSRGADNFSMWCAAGELAAEFGAIDVSVADIRAGVEQCLADWLKARGSVTKTSAQRAGLTKLHSDVVSDISTAVRVRDQSDKDMDEKVVVLPGEGVSDYVSRKGLYVGKFRKTDVIFLTEAYVSASTGKAKRADVMKQLDAADLLVRDKTRLTVRVYVPTPAGQVRVPLYAVKQAFLSLGADGKLADDKVAPGEKDRWGDVASVNHDEAPERVSVKLDAKPSGKKAAKAKAPAKPKTTKPKASSRPSLNS